jgi:16S rRNA G527 N7-methylase RsmG
MKYYNINKSELSQFKKVYQSTIKFDKFLEQKLQNSEKILDIGSGIGGTLSYYVKKYPKINFILSDYRTKNISVAKLLYKKKYTNINFIKFDIYKKKNFKKLQNPCGIISEKNFCTYKNIERPIQNLLKLNPKWIAINSLFYEGNMDTLIHVRDRIKNKVQSKDNNPDGDFNIFSLSNLRSILKKTNYRIVKAIPFYPSKKIIKKNNSQGTYTLKTEFNKNSCFTGPVFLPWFFILIEKK